MAAEVEEREGLAYSIDYSAMFRNLLLLFHYKSCEFHELESSFQDLGFQNNGQRKHSHNEYLTIHPPTHNVFRY